MTGHTTLDGRGDARGQAAVLGIVLLLGLVAAGSVGILLVGNSAQDQTQERVDERQIRVTYQELDSTIEEVARTGSEVRSVEFDLPDESGSALRREDTGRITVTRTNLTTEQQIVVKDIGALIYEENGRHYAYQSGAVWEGEGNATDLVSAPPIVYQTGRGLGSPTLTMPIVDLEGLDRVNSGEIPIESVGSQAPLNNISRFNNTLVTIEIQSDYYRGWGEYFDEQYEPIVVNYDHPNETAIIKIGRRDIPGTWDEAISTGSEVYVKNSGGTTFRGNVSSGSADGKLSCGDSNSNWNVTCDGGDDKKVLDSVIASKIDTAKSDYEDVTGDLEGETLDAGQYYSDGFELDSGSLTLDLSSGNVSLIVDGPIGLDGQNIEVINENVNSTCCFARVYVGGGLDGDFVAARGGSGVTTSTGEAKRFQMYGTSEMHFALGQTAVFQGAVHAPRNEPATGQNQAVVRYGITSGTSSCDMGDGGVDDSNPDVCIGTGSPVFSGTLSGFGNVSVAQSATFTYDDSVEEVSPTIGQAGVVPPDITFLHVSVNNVCVGGESCNEIQSLTADFSYSPSSPDVGETVTFDGSSSVAPDSSITSYEWDLNGDGFYTDASGPTASTSFGTAGNHDVSLRVTNASGATDTVTKTVSVSSNTAPTAVASSNRSSAHPGEDFEFDASGSSDIDGSIAGTDWDLDDDGSYDDASGATVVHSFGSTGSKTVEVRVTDDDGATSTATVTVSVVSNSAPTAAITQNRTNPDPGQDVEFDGSGSTDADGSVTAYEWDLDDDGAYDDATGPTAVRSFSSAGTYDVGLRVTDDDGDTDTETKTVTVGSVNSPPMASANANRSSAHPGEDVEFDGSGSSDSDGSISSYEWDLDDDGSYDDATGATVVHSFGSTGSKTVGLKVTDDDGSTDTDTVTVSVTANSAPTADFSHTPSSPNAGDSITFNGTPSSDSDGSISSYEWDVDNDGTYEKSGDKVTHSFGSAGTYDVSLQVTDDDGATDTVTKTVSVSSSPQPPTFSSTSVRDNSKTTGPPWNREARYDVSYSVSDASGSPNFDHVEVTFDWTSGGPTTITSSSMSDTISYSNSANGESFTITIELYDDTGSVVECREYTDTADNTDPSSYGSC